MNPESLYYASSGNIPMNNTELQLHNLYRMQSPPQPWSSGYSAHGISGLPNMVVNNDAACLDQPLVTPVSTAMYGTTSTCSWAHTVPNLMPWVPTKGESSVVRFSAPSFLPDPCTSQAATSWELMHSHLNLKRKTDPDGPDDTPQKVCITEEKMAARFRDMHISNQFTIPSESSSTSKNTTSPSLVNKTPTNLQQLELMLQDSGSSDTTSKSLILAPEIKKLVEPEKILNTFLNKIEKPSMALVVWQPPANKLLEKKETEPSGITPDLMKHNNNNLTPQQLSLMCHQYLSSQESGSGSYQTLSEDVMEI